MNIRGNSITINQVTDKESKLLSSKKNVLHELLTYRERGLSRSRNHALDEVNSDIVVIADDDIYYEDDYDQTIARAYDEFPRADVIIFHVDSDNPRQRKKILKKGKLNRIMTLKVASWQITFKRESILNSNIRFDENFGAGTQNYMGEENIFLYDCARKGLKIYYMPNKIATLKDTAESTWFEGYTERYFMVKGAIYRRMSGLFWVAFMIQFAIKKRNIYAEYTSFHKAIWLMTKGAIHKR